MPKLQEIYTAINELAPWDLAEDWDHSGLQIGHPDRPVKRVLIAVDFNQDIFEEGLSHRVDGFIVHHPLLFNPFSQIDLSTPFGKQIANLINHDLFVISAHTNADNAVFGINRYLADLFGLQHIETIDKAEPRCCKLVVFVPQPYVEAVRDAMASAGAGEIGDYHYCSFTIPGSGSFLPGADAHPFIGKNSQLETVSEIRLEMMVELPRLTAVIKALFQSHPYEEPTYDIYPLINRSDAGLGRIGTLLNSLSLEELCHYIKAKLNADTIRVSGSLNQTVQKVALCTGSGKSLIPRIIGKADVYVTADLGYHDFCNALESGMALIDIGHRTSEKCFIDWLTDFLTTRYSSNELTVIKSSTMQHEPYQFV